MAVGASLLYGVTKRNAYILYCYNIDALRIAHAANWRVLRIDGSFLRIALNEGPATYLAQGAIARELIHSSLDDHDKNLFTWKISC